MNWQDGMCDPGTKITCRIDGKTRGAAQTQSNHHHQNTDYQWLQPLGEFLCTQKQKGQNQHSRGSHFAEQIGECMADGRCRAKHSPLGATVIRAAPVRKVVKPHTHRSNESTRYLRQHITGYLRPRKTALVRQSQRNGRVQVGTANTTYCINSQGNGHAPREADNPPPSVLGFTAFQHTSGHHPVSDQNQ